MIFVPCRCSDNVDCLSSEVRGTQGQLSSVEGDLSELRATVIGLSDELDTIQSTQADTNAAVNAEVRLGCDDYALKAACRL